MALLNIPLSNDPDAEFTIELDQEVFRFRVTRNERSARYKMDIFTEAGELILAGVVLVANFPILKKFKDERLPAGDLFLWDSTGRNREPTEDTLGIEHLLLYQEATA